MSLDLSKIAPCDWFKSNVIKTKEGYEAKIIGYNPVRDRYDVEFKSTSGRIVRADVTRTGQWRKKDPIIVSMDTPIKKVSKITYRLAFYSPDKSGRPIRKFTETIYKSVPEAEAHAKRHHFIVPVEINF